MCSPSSHLGPASSDGCWQLPAAENHRVHAGRKALGRERPAVGMEHEKDQHLTPLNGPGDRRPFADVQLGFLGWQKRCRQPLVVYYVKSKTKKKSDVSALATSKAARPAYPRARDGCAHARDGCARNHENGLARRGRGEQRVQGRVPAPAWLRALNPNGQLPQRIVLFSVLAVGFDSSRRLTAPFSQDPPNRSWGRWGIQVRWES